MRRMSRRARSVRSVHAHAMARHRIMNYSLLISMNQAGQPASGAEVVRQAVAKVISSAIFADSNAWRVSCASPSKRRSRQRRPAEGDRHRSGSFRSRGVVRSRLDPIVRVEARRLRSKLLAYYEGEGKDDELIIEFPKGTISRFSNPVERRQSRRQRFRHRKRMASRS